MTPERGRAVAESAPRQGGGSVLARRLEATRTLAGGGTTLGRGGIATGAGGAILGREETIQERGGAERETSHRHGGGLAREPEARGTQSDKRDADGLSKLAPVLLLICSIARGVIDINGTYLILCV